MIERAGRRRRTLLSALGAAGGLVLAGCDKLSTTRWFPQFLGGAEKLDSAAQQAVAPRRSMAQEFEAKDLSPTFRSNGTSMPADPRYRSLAASGFADYRLEIAGLVEHPAALTLAELRAAPSRTQITRHDCVEGWSAIGKWKGAKLGALLDQARPLPQARYVVFRCADAMDEDGTLYYESIDLDDAYHPQTILAYELNDRPLPIANGAPVRVRVERQLGYKMAKYIMRIELAASLAAIGGGRGGYWEDLGYQWYAGI